MPPSACYLDYIKDLFAPFGVITVRKMFGERKVQPYVGGGLAYIDGEIEVSSVSVSYAGIGFWANGGVLFRIGSRFNLGIDVRYSDAEIEPLPGAKLDAGGTHVGLLVGFRWGAS